MPLPINNANSSPYLIWEEASISKEFEVEGQDESPEEDETREEEDIRDVVRSVTAVRQRSIAAGLALSQRPVDLHYVELILLSCFCIIIITIIIITIIIIIINVSRVAL